MTAARPDAVTASKGTTAAGAGTTATVAPVVGASVATIAVAAEAAAALAETAPLAVKVMIVNMFRLEAAPWLTALHPTLDIEVPGLPHEDPAVHCTPSGVCQVTTGMGLANAAASMTATLYNPKLDLRKTYFVIAGIGGIDPERGTVGSAAWARYVVDFGIAHEIDARELPPGWQDGYFGIYTNGPDEMPRLEYGTEIFQLDEALLQRALTLSRSVVLEDSEDIQAYRHHYTETAARLPPTVVQCDTLTNDTWWSGRRLGEHARRWTRLLTHGAGNYCTSQQEDNATLGTLTRAAASGRIDLKRVAVLRTGSDFDRPYPQQSVFDSMRAQRDLAGAFRTSVDNLVRAGMPLVEAISTHWDRWEAGVPAPDP